ncbi:hypothetical protein ACE1OC_40630 [Streptomyces sp. DSM 116496]|uniref:hypothetical protein n=1 Tax=Streptomyces stoeckheimensis TaxID=3344656 RepID=UPI0038B3EB0F
MSHALHDPTPGRHIARLGICIAVVVFGAGAFALPASAAIASPAWSPATSTSIDDPNSEPGTGLCKSGYVYRDAWEGDGLCVTPQQRDAAHAQNPNRQPGSNQCAPGYVYRDAWEGDGTCVTPQERDKAHAQNPNRQPGSNQCAPGYVYRDAWEGDGQCVTPEDRDWWAEFNPHD